MFRASCFLTITLTLSGCASIKQHIAASVKEAVTEAVATEIDKELGERGLSLQEIKNVTDANSDGQLTRQEITETVKDFATDYIAVRLEDAKKEVDSTKTGLWGTLASIVLMVLTYLVRELRTSKTHGKHEARLDILEKLLNKDLDGDGDIGLTNNPENSKPTQV